MSDVDRYDGWAARRQLIRHTAASFRTGLVRARAQELQFGPGLNDLSYDSSWGVSTAQMGRLLAAVYGILDVPVARYNLSVRPAEVVPEPERRVFPVTLGFVQASHVPTAVVQHPRLFAPSRFRASVVQWELPRVPLVQSAALPFLDEVWTTSGFVADAFSAVTRKPVRVLPVPVLEPTGVPGSMRARLGIRDEYLFGYQFDLVSSGERKNPLAVAQAYMQAFPRPRDHVRLLLKSVHGAASPHVWGELSRAVADRPDVLLVDDYWPTEVAAAFFLDIDCYVSLHRAEGFGLTLAHAMAAGKPVIATGYSGNLDFMDARTSILIPSRIVPVGRDPVYPGNGTWAEPDCDIAADAMRVMADDPASGRALGAAARQRILSTRTLRATADWLTAHVPQLS